MYMQTWEGGVRLLQPGKMAKSEAIAKDGIRYQRSALQIVPMKNAAPQRNVNKSNIVAFGF